MEESKKFVMTSSYSSLRALRMIRCFYGCLFRPPLFPSLFPLSVLRSIRYLGQTPTTATGDGAREMDLEDGSDNNRGRKREGEREMKINTPLLARQAGWSCAAWPHPQARSCSRRRSTFGAQSSNATVEGRRPKRPQHAIPPQSQPTSCQYKFPQGAEASEHLLPPFLTVLALLACLRAYVAAR